jgi:hypothetical protein
MRRIATVICRRRGTGRSREISEISYYKRPSEGMLRYKKSPR